MESLSNKEIFPFFICGKFEGQNSPGYKIEQGWDKIDFLKDSCSALLNYTNNNLKK